MTLLQTIILGIVQGLTEFIPVSSSAHLVITPFVFGWQIPDQEAFIFDVIVQLGTLLAVIVYFWRDIVKIIRSVSIGVVRRQPFFDASARLGWLIILATFPAGVIGLLLKDQVEAAFTSVPATSIFLLITALLLLLAERKGRRNRSLEQLSWKDALWIGFFQAAAIFPGISRSGATISGGLFRDVERPAAARFSFLMSLPIMLLAGVSASADLITSGQVARQAPTLAAGFLTSALVGYLSIHWLLSYLNKRSLRWFAVYCLLMGSFMLALAGIQSRKSSPASFLPAEATPQPVRVALSPSLSHYAERISGCSEAYPDLAVFIDVIPLSQVHMSQFDLVVSFGMPPLEIPFLYPVGEETLRILVNAELPVDDITQEALNGIFSGSVQSWSEVQPAIEPAQAIRVLQYPAESDLSSAFIESLQLDGEYPDRALIVPTPQAMLEGLSQTPGSIGYLPGSVDIGNHAVKYLKITGDFEQKLRRSVLVGSNREPEGSLKNLIGCLQQS